MFNIILPKACTIVWQIFSKIYFKNWSNSIFSLYNTDDIGRIIYFRENSIASISLLNKYKCKHWCGYFVFWTK